MECSGVQGHGVRWSLGNEMARNDLAGNETEWRGGGCNGVEGSEQKRSGVEGNYIEWSAGK